MEFRVIELREGSEVDYEGYHYRVGANKYGLWLSRRKLGESTEKSPMNDKPPARPPMTEVADPTLVQIIAQLTDAVKLLALVHLASGENEQNEIRKKVLAQ